MKRFLKRLRRRRQLDRDLEDELHFHLEDVLWGEASDFRQLLLADYLYLNGRLAQFYGAKLPADYPKDVPVYDGGKVIMSQSATEKNMRNLVLESTDPLQYPQKLVSNSDLAARLDQLQTLVIVGIVLGALALLASGAGLVMRRR